MEHSFFQSVSFSGSRHSLPNSSIHCANAVLSNFSQPVSKVGGSFVVGCCPSGLDFAVRSFCKSNSLPLRVLSVVGERSVVNLRNRTLRMVSEASCLFAFPQSVSTVRSGTWLATFSAFNLSLPVFVCLPGVSASSLPCCRGVSGWRSVSGSNLPVSIPGNFFVPFGVAQLDFFNS